MPTVFYVTSQGEKHEVAASDGESVMRAAVSNLVPGILGECGGQLTCATCHVFVDQDWAARVPEIGADEATMLEVTAAEPTALSRLSCQLTCSSDTDGLVVHIPEEQ